MKTAIVNLGTIVTGDWRKPKDEVTPGFPAFLGGGDAKPQPPDGTETTGRRAASR